MSTTCTSPSALVAVIAALCLTSSGLPAEGGQASVERGQKVFLDQKCSVCHAVAGKGNPKGALDEIGGRLKADEIREWIVNAPEMTKKTKAERKPLMRAYTSLSKEDVDGLVAYLSTLKKK